MNKSNALNNDDKEYRDLTQYPKWYCVRTTYKQDGTIDCEIIRDEKGNTQVITNTQKPHDAIYETPNEVIYYTYHLGYKEANEQVEATKINIGKSNQLYQSYYLPT